MIAAPEYFRINIVHATVCSKPFTHPATLMSSVFSWTTQRITSALNCMSTLAFIFIWFEFRIDWSFSGSCNIAILRGVCTKLLRMVGCVFASMNGSLCEEDTLMIVFGMCHCLWFASIVCVTVKGCALVCFVSNKGAYVHWVRVNCHVDFSMYCFRFLYSYFLNKVVVRCLISPYPLLLYVCS